MNDDTHEHRQQHSQKRREIDPVSVELGMLGERLLGIKDRLDVMDADRVIERAEDNLLRREQSERTEKVTRSIDALTTTLKRIEPIVDDYHVNKSKAWGIMIALCGVGMGMGWLIDKALTVFGKK